MELMINLFQKQEQRETGYIVKLQNPHDKFFKKTFGNVDAARDFLKNYLPQKIADIIDIDTLEPQKDSHIDEKLRETFSDLLFRTSINNQEGYLYLLFEHKSYSDRGTAFQLLKNMVSIWSVTVKEEGRLPLIIPLVIYHGGNGWNIRPTLGEIILGYDELPKDVRSFIPNYEYLLYDLSRFTDEEIKGRIENRIAMTVFRDIMKRDIDAVLKSLAMIGELKDKKTGLEYFETVMRYIFSARSDLTYQAG